MRGETKDTLKLWAWLVSGLVVLALGVAGTVFWSAKLTSFWAQLIGSALAFGGLLVAYLRARHPGETLREQLKQYGARLMGRQRNDVVIMAMPAVVRITGTAYAEVGLKESPDLDEVVEYIRTHIMPRFKDLYGRVEKVKSETERVERVAEEKANQAYAKSAADLTKFRLSADRSAAFDIRWAIFGVYVATIGVAVGYWA